VTIRELHVLLTSELCIFEAEGGLSWHALHVGVQARSRCTGVWSAWPLGYEKRRAFSHLPHGVALRAAMASATFSDMNAAVMLGDFLSDGGAHRCKYLDVVAGCRLCQWLGSEAVVMATELVSVSMPIFDELVEQGWSWRWPLWQIIVVHRSQANAHRRRQPQ
jgi:hypothetical protein